MDYAQVLCGPVLANEKIEKFFAHKGLYEYNGNEFYNAYMCSQE